MAGFCMNRCHPPYKEFANFTPEEQKEYAMLRDDRFTFTNLKPRNKCWMCLHQYPLGKKGCQAFPEGNKLADIISGLFVHYRKHPDQKDNEIVFKKNLNT